MTKMTNDVLSMCKPCWGGRELHHVHLVDIQRATLVGNNTTSVICFIPAKVQVQNTIYLRDGVQIYYTMIKKYV